VLPHCLKLAKIWRSFYLKLICIHFLEGLELKHRPSLSEYLK
jgi:hypothetical protein